MSQSIDPKETREGRIRQRAHEIYRARGGQQGDLVSDWLVAEREFDESNESQGPKKARVTTASLWMQEAALPSAALQVIGDLAKYAQVLFFTHHMRLSELGIKAGARIVTGQPGKW
jgi:hypothetical protein